MAATLATVETYLTAAQTAFASGDFTTCKKQLILGEMELVKLPEHSEIAQASVDKYRDGFDKLRKAVEEFRKESTAGSATRRLVARST